MNFERVYKNEKLELFNLFTVLKNGNPFMKKIKETFLDQPKMCSV
jgi:hypothetical protein